MQTSVNPLDIPRPIPELRRYAADELNIHLTKQTYYRLIRRGVLPVSRCGVMRSTGRALLEALSPKQEVA